jgi:1-acyl-sn-glycerol-3-phosphate acyltransferase
VIVIIAIGTLPLMFVEWVLGKFRPDLQAKSSLCIARVVFRFLSFISGTKLIVIGKEKIPLDTPVLYVGNHRSIFDIILTYPLTIRRTGYVAKKEMNKIPILRVWMRYIDCVFLDRHNIREGFKSILQAVEKLKTGISICIFPEGTRNRDSDTFLPFHEGSFKIAEKAKVPIVPMTILNSAAIFEDHFPKIKRATVVVVYGDPIYPDTLKEEGGKTPGHYVQKIIEKTYFYNRFKFFDIF